MDILALLKEFIAKHEASQTPAPATEPVATPVPTDAPAPAVDPAPTPEVATTPTEAPAPAVEETPTPAVEATKPEAPVENTEASPEEASVETPAETPEVFSREDAGKMIADALKPVMDKIKKLSGTLNDTSLDKNDEDTKDTSNITDN